MDEAVGSVRTDPEGGRTPPPDPAGPRSLLLVDSDPLSREPLADALRRRGHRVHAAATCAEAERLIATCAPDFAVIDYRLDDGPGTDLIPGLRAAGHGTVVVVLSCYASLRGTVAAVKAGAADVLARPVCVEEIEAALRGARCPPASAPSQEEIRRRHAAAALRLLGDDVAAASRVLGLDVRTLRRLLAAGSGESARTAEAARPGRPRGARP